MHDSEGHSPDAAGASGTGLGLLALFSLLGTMKSLTEDPR